MHVSNNAWPQGQGIGLKGPAGPWKANVRQSEHTLLIWLNLKPHLNHPEQRQVTQASLIYKGQCVCACLCVFVLYRNQNSWMDRDEIWHGGGPWGGKVRGFRPSTPTPLGTGCIKGVWGASVASTMRFVKNFIKQKFQGTPDLEGAGYLFGPRIWIWKDLGPMSFWSHGHSLWRGAHKIKVALYVPNSYLVGLDTPSILILKPSLNHSGQRRVTQASVNI